MDVCSPIERVPEHPTHVATIPSEQAEGALQADGAEEEEGEEIVCNAPGCRTVCHSVREVGARYSGVAGITTYTCITKRIFEALHVEDGHALARLRG